jgi:hypothetical protein
VKKLRTILNLLYPARVYLIDFFQTVEKPAWEKELDLERQLGIAPQGLFGLKAYVSPLIVSKFGQKLGKVWRLLERLSGKTLSLPDHILVLRISLAMSRNRKDNKKKQKTGT